MTSENTTHAIDVIAVAVVLVVAVDTDVVAAVVSIEDDGAIVVVSEVKHMVLVSSGTIVVVSVAQLYISISSYSTG